MLIMGVDPGIAITGYGIIEYLGNKFKVIDCGCIRTSAGLPMPERLLRIYDELDGILAHTRPDEFAIEELFFSKNARTALTVGHARGVSLLPAARLGLGIHEYTPLQVKQAVVGYGRADKGQVQYMVKTLLGLKDIPRPDDVADALAVAICHAHSRNGLMLT